MTESSENTVKEWRCLQLPPRRNQTWKRQIERKKEKRLFRSRSLPVCKETGKRIITRGDSTYASHERSFFWSKIRGTQQIRYLGKGAMGSPRSLGRREKLNKLKADLHENARTVVIRVRGRHQHGWEKAQNGRHVEEDEETLLIWRNPLRVWIKCTWAVLHANAKRTTDS